MLLLDEPLGALDLKLRQEMQIELKQIQRDVGITFIFVTHDQEEALTMSDRIAVFNAGRIEQVGTPHEVYEQPATRVRRRLRRHVEPAGAAAAPRRCRPAGLFSIRPEKIRIDGELPEPAAPGETGATGAVTDMVYAGATMRFVVDLDAGGRLSVVRQNTRPSAGFTDGRVRLTWRHEHNFPVPVGSERSDT